MTPDEQAALDFMRDFARVFEIKAFRVKTLRFTAVSPGVNPDVPLGEGGASRLPQSGGAFSARQALNRGKYGPRG